MKKTFFALLFVSLVVFAGASAPASKKAINPNKDDLIVLKHVPGISIKKGQSAQSTITVTVLPGFHIQSNPAKPRLIPTTLRVEKDQGVELIETTYPKGKAYRLKNAKEDISVYEGDFKVGFKLKAVEGLKKGKNTVQAKLRYQACNDITCFFPKSIDVSLPVVME